MRRTNGITLIALVITIIVLLILAGVAIAMLSGENGILKKAAEAKTKTEEGKEQEGTALATAELETYFITNNLKYKCSNGFITGFDVKESVEDFEKVIKPLGYEVKSKYKFKSSIGEYIPIEESEKNTTYIGTGMTVEKEEKKLLIVVYGDLNGDSLINLTDSNIYKFFLRGNDISIIDAVKVAMDVNNDGKNDVNDYQIIKETYKDGNDDIINQNRYSKNPNAIIDDKESYQMEIYTNELSNNIKDSTIYSLEMKIDSKGIINELQVSTTDSIKVEELLTILPSNSSIKRNGQEVATTENIQNGDEIIYTYNEREIYIGKIVVK